MSVARARALRKSLTPQEARLWLRLRAMRLSGFHFRRQCPRDGYVLDFVCLRHQVIVEIDGMQHGFDREIDRDAESDRHFATLGFRTLRFTNGEVNRDIDGVVETVFSVLNWRETL